jgi:hypothetical protein
MPGSPIPNGDSANPGTPGSQRFFLPSIFFGSASRRTGEQIERQAQQEPHFEDEKASGRKLRPRSLTNYSFGFGFAAAAGAAAFVRQKPGATATTSSGGLLSSGEKRKSVESASSTVSAFP